MSTKLSSIGEFAPIKRIRETWDLSIVHVGLVMTILIIVVYIGDIVTNWNGGKLEFQFQTQRDPGTLEWIMIVVFTTLFAFVEKFIIFLVVKFLQLMRKGPRGKSAGASLEFYGLLVGMIFLGFLSVYMFLLDIYWTRLALRSIFSDYLALVLSIGVNAFQFVTIALIGYNTKPAADNTVTANDPVWVFHPAWNVVKVAVIIAVGMGFVYYVAVLMPTQSNTAVVVNSETGYVPMDLSVLGVDNPVVSVSPAAGSDTSGGGAAQIATPVVPPAPQLSNGNTCPRVHVVQSGETLYRIATMYNWNYQDLARANGIVDPNRIAIGQQICIP